MRWVPGGIEREMHACAQAVSNRSPYIQPDALPDLPAVLRDRGFAAAGAACVIEDTETRCSTMRPATTVAWRLILNEICAVRAAAPAEAAKSAYLLQAVFEDPGGEGSFESGTLRCTGSARAHAAVLRRDWHDLHGGVGNCS